jgi:hypothetical protein
MLSLSIANVKDFMAKLLKSEVFDSFELHSLVIHNFVCFEINKIPAQPTPKWCDIRPHAFDIIKGGKTPGYIKAVLAMPGEGFELADTFLFINIHFEEGKINLTSGISQSTFTLDRSGHSRWNDFILQFLDENEISYINELQIS